MSLRHNARIRVIRVSRSQADVLERGRRRCMPLRNWTNAYDTAGRVLRNALVPDGTYPTANCGLHAKESSPCPHRSDSERIARPLTRSEISFALLNTSSDVYNSLL